MKRLRLIICSLILMLGFYAPTAVYAESSESEPSVEDQSYLPDTEPIKDDTKSLEDEAKISQDAPVQDKDNSPEPEIASSELQPDQDNISPQVNTDDLSSNAVELEIVPPEDGRLYISELRIDGGSGKEFVEIYNSNSVDVDLGAQSWYLEYLKESTVVDCNNLQWQEQPKMLTGIVPSAGRLQIKTLSMTDDKSGVVRLGRIVTGQSDTAHVPEDAVGWYGRTQQGVTVDPPCAEGNPAPFPPDNDSIARNFDEAGQPIDQDDNSTDFNNGSITPPGEDLCKNETIINEIYSDPVGLESENEEFVELFNPSSQQAILKGCHLKSNKSAGDLTDFNDSSVIEPGSYLVVKTKDKLTNSSGSITFITSDKEDVVEYSDAEEGRAYAHFSPGWQFTDTPTPGSANQLLVLSEEELAGKGGSAAVLPACPTGKYRNPSTNRCRQIETLATILTACDVGEYRSPETNRCRKFSTATSMLKPCSAGETRNPSTNRCRKVAASTSTIAPCKVGYERNPETNRCRKVQQPKSNLLTDETANSTGAKMSPHIIGVLAGALIVYGAYEYRNDAKNFIHKIKNKNNITK